MAEVIVKDSAIVTTLLEAKLHEVDDLIRDNKLTLRDDDSRGDLVSSVQIAIQELLDALRESETASVVRNIPYGSLNSSIYWNKFWGAIGYDLTALYAEASRIGKLVSDNHNYVMADVQGLLLQLKSANAKLASYELYASTTLPNKRSLVENFNDISQLEIGSKFVQGDECSVDTVQGIVTLATNDAKDNTVTQDDIEGITISAANSNGEIYNDTSLLKAINSGDFYLFQYEYTSQIFGSYRLVLDFTIKLKNPKILNYIRIVPNNYGTKTWPKILAMDLSMDGLSPYSVRDALLTDETNDTQFTLAPYTSNYAGEGRYSFLPVKAQYIHILIEQTSPYYDVNRDLYRWAIGLKNIELDGKEYKETSQLVSKDYTIPQGIAEISLEASEFPWLGDTEAGGQVSHEVSIDGGMNWKAISPTYLSGNGLAPEILYINSVDPSGLTEGTNHLNSTIESNTLRYRLSLSKDTENIPDTNLIPYYSPVVRKVTLNVITKEDI